jgi:hypothetical protein
MHGEKCIENYSWKSCKEETLRNLGIDGTIIMK